MKKTARETLMRQMGTLGELSLGDLEAGTYRDVTEALATHMAALAIIEALDNLTAAVRELSGENRT